MLRLQSSQAMDDLPWLSPENDSWNAQYSPTVHTDSCSHQISPSQFSSKSLIQFSPSHPSPLNRTDVVMSEPTRYDTSHFHQKPSSDHDMTLPACSRSKRCRATSPNKSNAVPLQYIDKHTKVLEPMSDTTSQNDTECIQSPDFYSAKEFSLAVSTTEHSEMILRHSSSSVFLPRGFSTGPQMNTFALAPQLSPIQRLLNELGEDESEQEDQAPELEMDMYDIII